MAEAVHGTEGWMVPQFEGPRGPCSVSSGSTEMVLWWPLVPCEMWGDDDLKGFPEDTGLTSRLNARYDP
jgi:hypothetical protein